MAISLDKGSRISLAKEAPGLSRVSMGLGWDPAKKTSGGGFLGKLFGGDAKPESIDLDASCLAFSGNRLVETVWFQKRDAFGDAIYHHGDNLTGTGDGDDEVIDINLDALPKDVDRLVLTVNSFRGQTFDEVDNAFCRIVDKSNGNEIARFTLKEKGGHTGVIMAVLSRASGPWEMKAVGAPANGRTARDMAAPALEAF